jgi:endonuclease YncB( thermonuclease family)
MGTLKINGKIRLDQFFPDGKSDADTTQLRLVLDARPFSFQASENEPFVSTNIFENARATGSGQKKNVIRNKAKANRHIVIRLQGIDAPELHFRIYDPRQLKKYADNADFKRLNVEYRQFGSQTATVRLSQHLKTLAGGEDEADCYFLSHNIQKPGDVIDVFGRFVGDVYVQDKSINQWLLQAGLVLPAFYNSMLDEEMDTLRQLYRQGKQQPDGLLNFYRAEVGKFDFDIRFDQKSGYDEAADRGSFILPKLYRRLCVYSILTESGLQNGTFEGYLRGADKSDKVLLFKDLADFRETKKSNLTLSKIVTHNRLDYEPDDIIFIEKDSGLVDENGAEIVSF